MNLVQPIRDKQKIEEIKAILKRQSGRDCFMFTVGINTGLRISDILKLQVKDVRDKTHVTLNEQKTGKPKRFRINANLRGIIDEYITGMSDNEYLFPSRKGDKPIGRVQAYKIMNAVAAKVGLDEIGCHTMRKTFGYWFYKQTKDVAQLQEILNHSAPSVTLRYIGINQDVIDKAIDGFSL